MAAPEHMLHPIDHVFYSSWTLHTVYREFFIKTTYSETVEEVRLIMTFKIRRSKPTYSVDLRYIWRTPLFLFF